mgnify:CR=1 FL=1
MPDTSDQTDAPGAFDDPAGTGSQRKPPDAEIEPLNIPGRANCAVIGALFAAFGWKVARISWIGFVTGEVAMLSLERNSAFRVYTYAAALLPMGAGAIILGAGLILRAFTPMRYAKRLYPIYVAAYIALLITILLSAVVYASEKIAPLFSDAD